MQNNINQFFIRHKEDKRKNIVKSKNNQISLDKDKYNNGYKMIKVNNRWVMKYRAVMEKHLGRKLKKGEIVHHFDHNKLNDKIENLILCKNVWEHKQYHCFDLYKYGELRRINIGDIYKKVNNQWIKYSTIK